LDKVRVHEVDLRESQKVRRLVGECQPSKVYHLAAVGVTEPGVDPRLAVQVNVIGTLNLLEALRETQCDCFVNTGTCYEYGYNTPPMREDQRVDPINVYAASKSAAWLFCNMYHRTHGYPIVTVRPFTAYGPRQSERALIPQVILSALRGEDFEMTGGEQTRDFTYVDDIAHGTVAALRPLGFEVFNLGGNRPVKLMTVIDQIAKLTGRKVRIEHRPAHPADVPATWADIGKAGELLGWVPRVTLEEGLRRCVAWYRDNRDMILPLDLGDR